jgi:hypothetical protein
VTSIITAFLGWACKLPITDLWKPEEIETSQVRSWIDYKIDAGIYDPGAADLYFTLSDGTEFLFCHESDVHVETSASDLLRSIVERWLERRYGVQGAFFGNKWQAITSASQVI